MKTTLQIPDSLHRQVKSKAASCGISLSQFVSLAIEDKFRREFTGDRKPWMKHIGKLKHLRNETKRINSTIKELDSFAGTWSNRKDLADSEKYVRRLRKGKRLDRIFSQMTS